MSKQMNECDGLSGILLNHSMTALVFFHWFRPVATTTLEFIYCRMILLMTPISDFAGFINLHIYTYPAQKREWSVRQATFPFAIF